jgi:DNA-binding NarL/FixJ family response regulator
LPSPTESERESDAAPSVVLTEPTSTTLDVSQKRKLRVLLVEDHQVMRTGLKLLLDAHARIDVVAEAGDGEQAVALADRHRPDVVLMDLAMPRMDGIAATQRIKSAHPAVRIIGLSSFDDRKARARMLAAGAETHLSKTLPGTRIVEAILRRAPRSPLDRGPSPEASPSTSESP